MFIIVVGDVVDNWDYGSLRRCRWGWYTCRRWLGVEVALVEGVVGVVDARHVGLVMSVVAVEC